MLCYVHQLDNKKGRHISIPITAGANTAYTVGPTALQNHSTVVLLCWTLASADHATDTLDKIAGGNNTSTPPAASAWAQLQKRPCTGKAPKLCSWPLMLQQAHVTLNKITCRTAQLLSNRLQWQRGDVLPMFPMTTAACVKLPVPAHFAMLGIDRKHILSSNLVSTAWDHVHTCTSDPLFDANC